MLTTVRSLTCLRMSGRTFMSSSLLRSSLAPTFASLGDTSKIVSRLGPNRIATMIVTGKPNRPFPPEFQVDLEEFLPGAISAAGVVTSSMSAGDWGSLEGLVDRDCINSLQATMHSMEKVQKDLVVLNPEDVFLSFISNPDTCDSGNNLHMVTFSLPRLEQMKEMIKENKELSNDIGKEFNSKIENSKNAGSEPSNEDILTMMKKMKAQTEEVQAKLSENDPHNIFKENEILVGNFRFVRDSPTSQWTVKEVAQINSLQAWAAPFRFRWRGRLGISTRGGFDFYKVLRVDYLTDYIIFAIIFGDFYMSVLKQAGMVTAPIQ